MPRSWGVCVLVLCAAAVWAPPCRALAQRGTLGPIEYTVFAPDWTWQARDINIMAVLRNDGATPAEVTLDLVFPEGKRADFKYAGTDEALVTVPAGGAARHAFTGLIPSSRVPRQTYVFHVDVHAPEGQAHVEYPLRTIRGAAVSPGKWAVFLPAGLALAWCAVFAAALSVQAPRGAWRRPSPPIDEPEAGEAWIHQSPK